MSKIKYGVCNVYISPISFDESNTIVYGTPFHEPGIVSLDLDSKGEIVPFYADNITYYQSASNDGYEGDLEMAKFSDKFRKDILNEREDKNKVLIEDASNDTNPFAIAFQFENDIKANRHWMYNCKAGRPKLDGKTKEDKKDPGSETLTLSVKPLANGLLKARTKDETPDAIYNAWFTEVYVESVVTEPEV